MESIFLISDEEAIDSFNKQNPTQEDCKNVGETNPEFLAKHYQNRSTWDDDKPIAEVLDSTLSFVHEEEDYEDEEEEIDRYDIDLPEGYQEIELYDSCKTFCENFETGRDKKYILFEVNDKGSIGVKDPNQVLPSPQSKCIIDLLKVDDHSLLEFIPVDYDTFWGLRFKSFMRYNCDYFLCDERVMFEALLIKYKAFDFKPFYWSKEVMFDETGIKKDRATNIIRKFMILGILSKKLIKTKINNRPMQINYYDIKTEKIIELIPQIYKDSDDIDIEYQIKKYLHPVTKK